VHTITKRFAFTIHINIISGINITIINDQQQQQQEQQRREA